MDARIVFAASQEFMKTASGKRFLRLLKKTPISEWNAIWLQFAEFSEIEAMPNCPWYQQGREEENASGN